MVFGRFSALHPTRRQATPRGLAFRGPRGFGHGLTFGRKSSEFDRGCHWGAIPVRNFGDPQLEPLLAQYFNAWANSSRFCPTLNRPASSLTATVLSRKPRVWTLPHKVPLAAIVIGSGYAEMPSRSRGALQAARSAKNWSSGRPASRRKHVSMSYVERSKLTVAHDPGGASWFRHRAGVVSEATTRPGQTLLRLQRPHPKDGPLNCPLPYP